MKNLERVLLDFNKRIERADCWKRPDMLKALCTLSDIQAAENEHEQKMARIAASKTKYIDRLIQWLVGE